MMRHNRSNPTIHSSCVHGLGNRVFCSRALGSGEAVTLRQADWVRDLLRAREWPAPLWLPPPHRPTCCWGDPEGSAARPAPGQGAALSANGQPETYTCTPSGQQSVVPLRQAKSPHPVFTIHWARHWQMRVVGPWPGRAPEHNLERLLTASIVAPCFDLLVRTSTNYEWQRYAKFCRTGRTSECGRHGRTCP